MESKERKEYICTICGKPVGNPHDKVYYGYDKYCSGHEEVKSNKKAVKIIAKFLHKSRGNNCEWDELPDCIKQVCYPEARSLLQQLQSLGLVWLDEVQSLPKPLFGETAESYTGKLLKAGFRKIKKEGK